MINEKHTETENYLVQKIVQMIIDDPEVQEYTKERAASDAQTTSWTPEQYEQNEDTVQYDSYYSNLSRHQARIAAKVAAVLAGL